MFDRTNSPEPRDTSSLVLSGGCWMGREGAVCRNHAKKHKKKTDTYILNLFQEAALTYIVQPGNPMMHFSLLCMFRTGETKHTGAAASVSHQHQRGGNRAVMSLQGKHDGRSR